MAFSVSSSPISVSVTGGGQVSAWYQSSQTTSISVYGGGLAPSGGSLSFVGSTPSSYSSSQLSYVLSPEKPSGMAWLSTRLDSGTFGFSARTSTGYFAVQWWDGIVSVYGSGSASQFTSATKSVATTGAFARSAPKSVYIWPVASSSLLSQSGGLTGLSASSKKITAVSVDDCYSLTSLSCDSNDMEYLSLSRCTSLATLSCFGNRLRSIDLTSSPAITSIYAQNNLLGGIDVGNQANLSVLQCNSNQISSLNLLANQNLTSLFCHNNLLSSLNLSACKQLTHLNCSGNVLTSIRAVGLSFSNPYGANLSGNLLDFSQISQFYSDLATSPAGTTPPIFVAGNRSGGNTLIAEGKGYAVYG